MKNSATVLCMGIVLLNCVTLFLPLSSPWLSVPLALPLVFFIPGYMLTLALTHPRQLDVFYALTFGIGLSLTLDILSGFLLNLLPTGLNERSWIGWLSFLSLIIGLVTLYLRKDLLRTAKREGREQSLLDTGLQVAHPSSSTFWVKACHSTIYAFAIILVVCALIYATREVAEGQQVGFTQLWLLPTGPHTSHCTMQIGVRSFENSTVPYHITITVNNNSTQFLAGLRLTPHQPWLYTLVLQPAEAKPLFVEVKLYRDDRPSAVYRAVHVTLDVVQNRQGTLTCVI